MHWGGKKLSATNPWDKHKRAKEEQACEYDCDLASEMSHLWKPMYVLVLMFLTTRTRAVTQKYKCIQTEHTHTHTQTE
jgi:hypothetical protein